ncbi:uncharacterized protein BO88DRAFT_429656 [Aspergillus vadensis CBS 113365]|uniref:Uncharacterized protein n=1 Tax=Aspergillus vadensis (strain CBS 113365 / IMI 142717 / IBT 24658) TaxID=1448311 RepID=A0A319C642_ASPVC|nr:hypothetical protein BO88DRAFT_429656 [Aspergillus vadensis CBS 113365]PYH64302.1 hypothetical protein BO88DRAFT_429656 [Aspergillus vadensis CBS 113365]
MSAPEFLVGSLDQESWNEWAERYKAKGVSIYELEAYDPASKINDPQYLALRALWKFGRASEFHPGKWGIYGVEAATEKLGELKHWKSFLDAISLETNLDEILPIQDDLGAFTLIWYYGQLIRWAPSAADAEGNANFTPWSERLRKRKPESRSKTFSEPTQPHPHAINLADYMKIYGDREKQSTGTRELPSSSESQICQSSETAYIDLDPEACSDDSGLDPSYKEQEDFPQVSDEIMVNAYLLGLASVVTFSVEGVEAHWTPERKGYKVCDEKGIKLYEARTDGHMFLYSNGETKAIVEVKPVVRAELPRVMMQEVAQMAAWIHAEKDVAYEEKLAEQWFRRLLWSMNRHELYIIIAEYNGDYVDYLTNPRREAECESFMTMNQFGPWDIRNSTQVAEFAAILLAVTLQLGKGLPLI